MTTGNEFFEAGFARNNAEMEVPELEISGHIPGWVNGLLIRNGPGLVRSDRLVNHWFDGLAMLHRFEIRTGKVGYKSRFLNCKAYEAVKETGKIAYQEFATDPCRDLFRKVQVFFSSESGITDSAKVNVANWQGKAFALGEPLMQSEFDPETLERVGVFHYDQPLTTGVTTAHPHIEGERLYNLVQKYSAISRYKIMMSDGQQTVEEASVAVEEPAYLHSFGMSRRHHIIAAGPLVVKPLKLLFGARPFIENFKWKPVRGTRFYIFDRSTGALLHDFRTRPFFSFHHVNAFEDGDRIVMDLVIYEDASIIDHYYFKRLSGQQLDLPFGRLCRITYDPKSRKADFYYLSDQCIELPHFDYAYGFARPDYRYVYGIGLRDDRRQSFYNQLVKIDIASRQNIFWHEEGAFPGEPVFVPAPDRKSEDDGVILTVVLHPQRKESYLVVLDALRMKEIGRARLPQQLLIGFHGIFFPDQKLS
jgi:beta,beta-carotene 9',10'-dioxygenase